MILPPPQFQVITHIICKQSRIWDGGPGPISWSHPRLHVKKSPIFDLMLWYFHLHCIKNLPLKLCFICIVRWEMSNTFEEAKIYAISMSAILYFHVLFIISQSREFLWFWSEWDFSKTKWVRKNCVCQRGHAFYSNIWKRKKSVTFYIRSISCFFS